MPETGHATKQDLINEAQTLCSRLLPHVGALRENEREFVETLNAKIQQYGERAFVSAKQLFWLRDIEQKHVPDERQESLF
jgi:hypothetical protein